VNLKLTRGSLEIVVYHIREVEAQIQPKDSTQGLNYLLQPHSKHFLNSHQPLSTPVPATHVTTTSTTTIVSTTTTTTFIAFRPPQLSPIFQSLLSPPSYPAGWPAADTSSIQTLADLLAQTSIAIPAIQQPTIQQQPTQQQPSRQLPILDEFLIDPKHW
jgi:hypothetical protein